MHKHKTKGGLKYRRETFLQIDEPYQAPLNQKDKFKFGLDPATSHRPRVPRIHRRAWRGRTFIPRGPIKLRPKGRQTERPLIRGERNRNRPDPRRRLRPTSKSNLKFDTEFSLEE